MKTCSNLGQEGKEFLSLYYLIDGCVAHQVRKFSEELIVEVTVDTIIFGK